MKSHRSLSVQRLVHRSIILWDLDRRFTDRPCVCFFTLLKQSSCFAFCFIARAGIRSWADHRDLRWSWWRRFLFWWNRWKMWTDSVEFCAARASRYHIFTVLSFSLYFFSWDVLQIDNVDRVLPVVRPHKKNCLLQCTWYRLNCCALDDGTYSWIKIFLRSCFLWAVLIINLCVKC